MINWHRLFGLTLEDYFSGTSYEVELEKDLSKQRQLLDIVIIKKNEGDPPKELPDGLDNLKAHNLITYKSHQESLDGWAIRELVGHHISYRKYISPTPDDLISENEFQLYAISARYPKKLLKLLKHDKVKEGIYDIKCIDQNVRIIVLSQIANEKRNAVWQLFSANSDRVEYGAKNYTWKTKDITTIINELFEKYKIEGVFMPYTIEDFRRDYVLEHVHKLSADEILKNVSIEDRFKGLSIEDRFKGLSIEDRFKGLSTEDRFKGLSIEELLSNLPPEVIEAIKKNN